MGKHKKRKHGSEDEASASSGARTGLLTGAVGTRSCNQTDLSPPRADEPTQKRHKKEHKKEKRKEEKRKEEKRLLKEAKKFLKNSAPAELLCSQVTPSVVPYQAWVAGKQSLLLAARRASRMPSLTTRRWPRAQA